VAVIKEDQYERYYQFLLRHVSPEEAKAAVAKMRTEDDDLDRGICPRCGKKVTRRCDGRQEGPSEIAGFWYNYRCSFCKYMCDRKEPSKTGAS